MKLNKLVKLNLMKHLIFKFLVLGFVLNLVYSCSDDDSTEDTADPVDIIATFGIRHDKSLSDYEAIVSATGDYPNFDAVVFLSFSLPGDPSSDIVGSGVLIDDEWVLTAGHNFFSSEEQSSPVAAKDIVVYTGNNPNNPSAQYNVEMLVFHPTWLAQDDFFNGNDLCLIKLSSPITNITPVELITQNSVQTGSAIWASGFGDYSGQPGQDSNLYSNKHAIQNVLDRKTNNLSTTINGTTYNGGHLAFDFDNPSATVNSLGDDLVSPDEATLFGQEGTSSTLLSELEGTTVTGDSGGPIFIKDGSVWKVAGVLSGGLAEPIPNHTDGGYGDISLYTRTFPMLSWIQSTMQ